MKPEILTYTGLYVDLVNPKQNTICIEDIAHGLANTCRFNGQCEQFYSVAQHSVYASWRAPHGNNLLALTALLHDASEAYIGDVVSPLKQLLPDYKVIEKNLQTVINKKFDLPPNLPALVKQIDLRLLVTEGLDLMFSHASQVWECQGERYDFSIDTCWTPEESKQKFVDRFRQLTA